MGVQNQQQYTTLTDLLSDVQEIMTVYRHEVLISIEKNIPKCGDIFIEEVKKISPPNDGPGIGGHYRNSWEKKKLNKAKYTIYVGNTKKVKRHQKDAEPKIPLINILEFSSNPKKKRPHVSAGLSNSKDQIVETIIDGIEKAS